MTGRLTRPAAALAVAGLLAACSSPGPAPAPSTSSAAAADTVDLAALNTGPYATAPTHPFGTAGEDKFMRGVLESQRIAEATAGPWAINPKFVLWGDVQNTAITGRIPDAAALRTADMLADPLPDIAERSGLIAGFSTTRLAATGQGGKVPRFAGMQNTVMRFADPATAASVAQQMAAADPPPVGASGPGESITLGANRDALARSYTLDDAGTAVHVFTAHGPFVLHQFAKVPLGAPLGIDADSLADQLITTQKRLIDGFTPTPVDQLADLPLDPSGYLLARTLNNSSGSTPAIIGVWKPKAWVAFEDNPLEAAAMLNDAGVDWVSQRLATVYQTKNDDTAEQLLGKVVETLRRTESAKPTDAVPGMPRARCFERTDVKGLEDAAQSWQRVAWRFKCAAATGRYVFTTYAGDAADAMQRLSAQWRILAGK